MTTLLTASGRLNGLTFAAIVAFLAAAGWLVHWLARSDHDLRHGRCPQCGKPITVMPGLWEQCIAVHNEEFCGRGR